MKRIHFVGIGGARLSGLAQLYQDRGFQITGSDWQAAAVLERLAARGIKVQVGHDPALISGADLVVYSNAVGLDNPEVVAARQQGIPLLEGAQLLGQLMAEIGQGIAIAGTHGKTTTTAMTALVLIAGGLDPSVLIGGELRALGGNQRSGKSPYLLVEACEFKRSFLQLKPSMELITNIDWDHPDCFPNLEAVVQTFQEFVDLLPPDGTLIFWGDDPRAAGLGAAWSGTKVSFGYQSQWDWTVDTIEPLPPLGIGARLYHRGRPQGELRLQVPGRHNLQNALGAIALATELGVSPATALASLKEFAGVARRFEIKGEYRGALVVDDYAHHPAAIRSTLAAAREFFKGRIWCVFQPHLFSRTKMLLNEFAESFKDSDIMVLADIYPAREIDPGDISSQNLADLARTKHRDVRYLGSMERIHQELTQHLKSGDLVITMGAGDIWKVGQGLVQQ